MRACSDSHALFLNHILIVGESTVRWSSPVFIESLWTEPVGRDRIKYWYL